MTDDEGNIAIHFAACSGHSAILSAILAKAESAQAVSLSGTHYVYTILFSWHEKPTSTKTHPYTLPVITENWIRLKLSYNMQALAHS
jgi:hypothetical protein